MESSKYGNIGLAYLQKENLKKELKVLKKQVKLTKKSIRDRELIIELSRQSVEASCLVSEESSQGRTV
jgi:hypothetical protein